MTNIIAWLQAQLTNILPTIQAVIANKPEPARNVLISTTVLAGVAWLVLKIVKAVQK